MPTNHYRFEKIKDMAVIGGTFDPIHNGHLAVAEAAAAKISPQKVLFIPSGNPPHKLNQPITDAEHRYRMALLATADNPAFDVSRAEVDRPGPSFTVDTIRQLKEELMPGANISFITGADAMAEILTWHDAEALLKMCRFVAVTRPGTLTEGLQKQIETLKKKYAAKISLMDVPGLEISGSELRAAFAAGKSVRYMLPRAAEDYARRNHLYGTKPFGFGEAKKRLKARLSDARFTHTMGVVEAAGRLAKQYGADLEKARVAALLHDCTKEYSDDKKRILCQLWGIPLDDVLNVQISITHSLLSAESAKRDFGVYDEDIIQAIRYHTTGFKGMTVLDKVIMLADFIEPTRQSYPGLEDIRALAAKDINAALACGIKATIQDNEDKKRPIHPWSRGALEELV